ENESAVVSRAAAANEENSVYRSGNSLVVNPMQWMRWGRKKMTGAPMLVTDIPPATNYSGGLFVKEMLEAIDFAISDVFVLLNPHLTPQIPPTAKRRLRMRTEAKPIEQYHPDGNSEHTPRWIREQEIRNVDEIEGKILRTLLKFAERCGSSGFWV